jgi:hypothetical protein
MPDHTYREQIIDALLAAGVPGGRTPAGDVLLAWPAVLPALALEPREEGEESWDTYAARLVEQGELPLFCARVVDGSLVDAVVNADQLIDAFFAFSTLPPARAYLRWMCHEFMPAISRHGHYDPATGHAVPVGMELDALERKEGARDLWNGLFPGVGDGMVGQ